MTPRAVRLPAALALAAWLGAGLSWGAAAPAIPEMQGTLRAIESAILKGGVDTLRMGYQDAAKSRPSDVWLRIHLAWCVMPSDDSWNQLKAINAIYPENPWVHQGMGRIYSRWKMAEQAKAEFELSLKHSPRFYPALVGLGELARAAGGQEQAQARYRAALAIQEDAEARAGLGLSLLAQGKQAEAKLELTKAIAQWPDQPEALAALGRLAREAKEETAAVDYLSKLSALQPKDREVHKALAEAQLAAGQKEPAALSFERYLRLGGVEPEILRRVAGLYKEAGKAEAEERTLSQLSTVEKEAYQHPLRMSELAEARGALDEAEAQLLEAVDRAKDVALVHLRLATLRLKREQPREALEALWAAAAASGPEAAQAQEQATELAKGFKLPAKPAKGSVDKIYVQVSTSLNAFYIERLATTPKLAGVLKFRVRIDAEGKVLGVEGLEDTLGEPYLAGHVYFALREAQYPKHKREPVFEFELKPSKKAK